MFVPHLHNRLIHFGYRNFTSTTTTRAKAFFKKCVDYLAPKPHNVPPYAHVAQVGDPVLRCKASPVPDDMIDCPEIQKLIEHMTQVMHKFDCVGISVPQIGVSLKIIIMEFNEKHRRTFSSDIIKTRKMSVLPRTVMINPTLKILNYTKHKFPESCMSVKGYSADVERYESVLLSGIGKEETPNELQLDGWNARIVQHEMDHLDGKIFIDCMDSLTFQCTCWDIVNRKAGRVEIPFYK